MTPTDETRARAFIKDTITDFDNIGAPRIEKKLLAAFAAIREEQQATITRLRELLKDIREQVVTTYDQVAETDLKPEFRGTERVWCGHKSTWLYPGDSIIEVSGETIANIDAALAGGEYGK